MLKLGLMVGQEGKYFDFLIKCCEAGAKKGGIDGEVVFVGSDNPEADVLAKANGAGIQSYAIDYPSVYQTVRKLVPKRIPCQAADQDVGADIFFGCIGGEKSGDFYDRRKVKQTIGEWVAYWHQEYWLAVSHAWQNLKLQPDCPIDAGFCCKIGLLRPDVPNSEYVNWATIQMAKIVVEGAFLPKLHQYEVDLLLLDGWDWIVTPFMIDRFNQEKGNPRILAVTESLLPAFPGRNGYSRAIARGCQVTGCTAFYVDYESRTGKIIAQRTVPIFPSDSARDLARRGIEQEFSVLKEALTKHARRHTSMIQTEQVTAACGAGG